MGNKELLAEIFHGRHVVLNSISPDDDTRLILCCGCVRISNETEWWSEFDTIEIITCPRCSKSAPYVSLED